jgi:DNA-binding NarL/FixJ family response regulator
VPNAVTGSTRDSQMPASPTNQPDWPLRVLIVDDHASTRRLLRRVFEHSPEFDVIGEADNEATAIDMADVLHPDVILLDLFMPESHGSSALGRLLRVVPEAQVIVLSGMDESVAPPLLAAGAAAFVPKGLTPLELLERLSGIVGRPLAPATPATESLGAAYEQPIQPPDPNSLEISATEGRIRAASDRRPAQAPRQQRSGAHFRAADAEAAASADEEFGERVGVQRGC